MKLKKIRITRAKRTAMGRFVCRLLGDECGAVAMEYVVIALLVVAAAVGAAVYFGKTIKGGIVDSANMINNTNKTEESGNINQRMGERMRSGTETANTVSSDIAGDNVSDTAAE